MIEVDQLVGEARRVGAAGDEAHALRWLRAVCSVLADWAGDAGQQALRSALPAKLLSGAGSRGRSHEKALAASDGGERVALFSELGRRAAEQDPGKMAQTGTALLGLVKRELAPDQLSALLAALPPGIAAEVRDASDVPVWKYGLIPQSYARPPRKAHA